VADIDAIAQRYGVLPSVIVGQSTEDFCLNLMVASVGAEFEAKAAQRAKKEAEKWRTKKRHSY